MKWLDFGNVPSCRSPDHQGRIENDGESLNLKDAASNHRLEQCRISGSLFLGRDNDVTLDDTTTAALEVLREKGE